MTQNKNDNKPIPVHGNITPITKQSVLEVKPHRWHEMSVAELYEQKTILDNRYMMACQIGNASLAQQVMVGINQIISLISQRSNQDINLI